LKLTRASLVTAAGLAGAVLAVPAAGALNRKPVAPLPTTNLLRAELHSTRTTLARATSQLARLQGSGAGTLHQQVSQLERTLSKAKAQLKTAEANSAALAAQLKAIPTPLGVAVEQVAHEVTWAQKAAVAPRGRLIAEAAMDYTVGHVSTGAFGYLELAGRRGPGYKPNKILAAQAGICGQASWVFAAIVRRFGLRVRSVTFSYVDPGGSPDGHTAVEVLYGGEWHFFDPTYGQFWTDAKGEVVSVAQIRAGVGTRVKDLASFTNVIEDTWFADDTWFITDPATTVRIGTLTLKS
jgi:Transglutaminase-like superfamily